MNTTSSCSNIESRWRTYLKAMVFLLPAIICWQFVCMLVLPKLRQLWEEAGATVSNAQWVMNIINLLVQYGLVILITALLILVLLDFCSKTWACYRRLAVGITVWFLNSIVLAGLTAAVVSAVLVAASHHTK